MPAPLMSFGLCARVLELFRDLCVNEVCTSAYDVAVCDSPCSALAALARSMGVIYVGGGMQAEAREAASKAGEAAHAAYQASRDPDDVEEEEVLKQREWDDWKDEHPTGYGNSKLRPCAT